jgi:hypothetical protein
MTMLDVFKSDAFSVTTLTDAINKIKYVPRRLGSLGLFRETGVITTSVVIEEKDGVLVLVSPTPRGGPGHTLPRIPRRARALRVPHFEINDSVMAEEVEGVRAWGSETEVETMQAKVGEKFEGHTNSMGATQEYSRVGAVKGLVTYADGSELNLFDEFGVTPPSDVPFDLLNGSPVLGEIRAQCAEIARSIGLQLDGSPFDGLYAICGDNFFDALIKHPEVRETYLNWNAAVELRAASVLSPAITGSWNVFPFGGVLWDNYFGRVGSTVYVDPDEAHIFPTGVPNLFRTYYAPADLVETVNTVGQRLYVQQYEMPNHKGIHLDTQMNSLDICTRPGVLIRALKGA